MNISGVSTTESAGLDVDTVKTGGWGTRSWEAPELTISYTYGVLDTSGSNLAHVTNVAVACEGTVTAEALDAPDPSRGWAVRIDYKPDGGGDGGQLSLYGDGHVSGTAGSVVSYLREQAGVEVEEVP